MLFIHRKYRLIYKSMNILEPEDRPKGLNYSVVSSKYQELRNGVMGHTWVNE